MLMTKKKAMELGLSEREYRFYSQIYYSLVALEQEVDFNEGLDGDQIEKVNNFLKFYHPEIFWNESWQALRWENRVKVTFKYYREKDKKNLRRAMQKFKATADYVLSRVPLNGSDYQKILFIHDYICLNTEYDWKRFDIMKFDISATAYGALIKKKAICQGYAMLFKYFMDRLGIECGFCYGSTTNSDHLLHAWNYVKCSGKYYWMDVTWDDPTSRTGEEDIHNHNYFLCDDSFFLKEHTPADNLFFVPKCTSTANNYHIRCGTYIEKYDIEHIKYLMRKYKSRKMIELRCSAKAVFDRTVDELIKNGRIFDVFRSAGISKKRYNYYLWDDLLTLGILM